MTSNELATLSTALWLVGTVTLFILLAEWSSGGSWGLTSAIVDGVRGWSDREARGGVPRSASTEPFRPILDPYAFLRRSDPPPAARAPRASDVDIIEHGERRLD